jgi:peroxiredoxin
VPQENSLLRLGDLAPDFTLRTAGGQPLRLADLRGRAVALFFFRGTWCGTCRGLMDQIRDHYADYQRLDAHVLGVTTQNADGLADYMRRAAIPFPIVLDPDRAVIRRYGVYNLLSFEGVNLPHNAVFLLDPAGVIRFVHVSRRSTDMPEEPLVRAALAEIAGMRNEE